METTSTRPIQAITPEAPLTNVTAAPNPFGNKINYKECQLYESYCLKILLFSTGIPATEITSVTRPVPAGTEISLERRKA
jgi:hypothetical protein